MTGMLGGVARRGRTAGQRVCLCMVYSTGPPVGDELGSAPGVPVPGWKQAAMALRKRRLFQRTVFPVGSPGWNRVVYGETGLSDGMLATVGWVTTAGAAQLPGAQAEPMEMDRAIESDG